MAKKETIVKVPERAPVISPSSKESEHHEGYLPKARVVFAILLVLVGIRDYLPWSIAIPGYWLNIVLVITGIYLIFNSFGSASARRRRALMKKYI